MRHLATVFALSAAVLLFGCAGAPAPTPSSTSTSSTGSAGSTGQPPIPADTPYVAGNWQFSAMSSVPGNPPLTFSGGISQASSALTVALHVNGSKCFNQPTTLGLTGTVMAGSTSMTFGSTSLTSTALTGQVVTFTGNFTDTTFTGTYSINGGCASGDQGSVTGVAISVADADAWDGTFTSSTQTTFHVTGGDFIQNTTASPDGSSAITGTATFDTPCFTAANLSPASFPSGSYIMGTLVSLQIKTANGTVTFTGTVDPATEELTGSYTVSGGTCDQTGTAFLVLTGQWDYH